jgi:hypothetical protein
MTECTNVPSSLDGYTSERWSQTISTELQLHAKWHCRQNRWKIQVIKRFWEKAFRFESCVLHWIVEIRIWRVKLKVWSWFSEALAFKADLFVSTPMRETCRESLWIAGMRKICEWDQINEKIHHEVGRDLE